jgi:hypothetical protein
MLTTLEITAPVLSAELVAQAHLELLRVIAATQ